MQDTSQVVEDSNTSVLCVPPQARYARVVRMAAANLASLAGLSVDEVDDVRMAAEEAFVYACATAPSPELRVEFALAHGEMAMTFFLGDQEVSEEASEPSLVYSALILDAMCDECSISDEPVRTMRLIRRTGNVDGL